MLIAAAISTLLSDFTPADVFQVYKEFRSKVASLDERSSHTSLQAHIHYSTLTPGDPY